MNEIQKINLNNELQLPQETKELLATIFEEGTAKNTLIAHQRDIDKFKLWASISYRIDVQFPVQPNLIIQYITDHLGGMKPHIDQELVKQGVKSKLGPHKLSTIKRRLYSLSAYHNSMGFKPNPVRDKTVATVLVKCQRALTNQGVFTDKKEAATADIMQKLIATCDDGSLKSARDAALLSVAFSSGGRRRSEIVKMRYEDLKQVAGGYTIKLYFSKGNYEGVAREFPVKGASALYLTKWLDMSKIKAGPLFRSVGRYQTIGDMLNAKAVNLIFKERAKLAGIEGDYSAHSIRSGFITSAASGIKHPITGEIQTIPIWEIMQMSGHKTSRSVDDYYRSGSILSNPAADIL